MQLGAGTIRNKIEATEFINEGADFIVSPGVTHDVASLADKNDILWIPGCMTPTEIDEAERNGASLVKIFPGNILGPGFVSAIKELFPNLLFMPTGGVEVDKENLQGWFKAGVVAVGMGSKLVSKKLMEEKNYTAIEKMTKEVLDLIGTIKK